MIEVFLVFVCVVVVVQWGEFRGEGVDDVWGVKGDFLDGVILDRRYYLYIGFLFGSKFGSSLEFEYEEVQFGRN